MEKTIDNLQIRPMLPEDRSLVEEFFQQMGEESASFFNRNRGNERRTLAFLEGRKPDHLFWLAEDITEDGPKMAGLVFLWDIQTSVPWLGIAVAENWQGKPLGRRLIGATKDWCLEKGRGGILLTTAQTNFRGQGLYERCGFEKLGVHHSGEFLYLLRFDRED